MRRASLNEMQRLSSKSIFRKTECQNLVFTIFPVNYRPQRNFYKKLDVKSLSYKSAVIFWSQRNLPENGFTIFFLKRTVPIEYISHSVSDSVSQDLFKWNHNTKTDVHKVTSVFVSRFIQMESQHKNRCNFVFRRSYAFRFRRHLCFAGVLRFLEPSYYNKG